MGDLTSPPQDAAVNCWNWEEKPNMKRSLIAMLLFAVIGMPIAAHAQTKVVFGLSTEGFLAAPFLVAKEKGYFEAQGIEVETVTLQGGSKALAATLSGDVDIMTAASIASVIQAQSKKQDVRAFAALVSELASSLVVQGKIMDEAGISVTSPIDQRLKVLKGLRIGITGPGSSTDKLVRYLSAAAGYKPDEEVIIVPVGNSAGMVASFSQDRIDAFILSSPTPETVTTKYGGKILIPFAKGEFEPLQHFLYSCLAARADWLEKNPDTARGIVRAIAAALTLLHENPEEAKAALRPSFSKLDDDVFLAAFDNNLSAYPRTPEISVEGLKNALEFAAATEGEAPQVDAKDLYTDRFYK